MERFSALMVVCLLAGLCLTGGEDNPTQIQEVTNEILLNTSVEKDALQNEKTTTSAGPEAGCDPPLYTVLKDLGALEERLAATMRAQEEANRRLEASEKKLSALETSADHQGTPRIAFSAGLTLDGNLAPWNIHQPLVYDHVMSNIGGHYSPVSGYFTAPVQGVYYFTFNSFSWPGTGTTGGSLHHNENRIVSWYGSVEGRPFSGTNSAVLQLQAGDKVNVRLWETRVIGDNTNHYSTFSGFFLFPV